MSVNGWLQIGFFVGVLTLLTPVLGTYMAKVYSGERVFLTPILAPVERLFYRAVGTSTDRGQDWKSYARSVLVFSALSWLLLYLILRTQGIQPFNPEGFASAPWDVTFNTTSSFVTNTNWQFYGGETTLSYFSQMVGLAVQNFVSAAVGMAVLVAVIRGIVSRGGHELGNFWVDLTRSLLYVLLPISIVGALFLVSQGVVQTLGGYLDISTLAGGQQGIAVGPAASQIAIKQLGTNGGGFFNVNSSMPFENPSALTNFVELLFILLIPGRIDRDLRADGRRPPPGLGSLRDDDGPAARRHRCLLRRRAGRIARPGRRRDLGHGPRLRQRRRQPGGQGAALRHRLLDRMGRGDDGGLERLRQLRPRLLHRHRRDSAPGQHADRRGDLRRRRLGPLRDAAVRPARRLHRRADGRPDP